MGWRVWGQLVELITVRVPFRGRVLEMLVPADDAPDHIRAASQLHMLTLALLNMENGKVDAVLMEFGFTLTLDGETLWPPPG